MALLEYADRGAIVEEWWLVFGECAAGGGGGFDRGKLIGFWELGILRVGLETAYYIEWTIR